MKRLQTFEIVHVFCLAIVCLYPPIFARNTYHDKILNPQTISDFIEPLPRDATCVLDWIAKNTPLLRYLAATPRPLSTWENAKAQKNDCLIAHGLENQGSNNFVFKCPETDWWIKISGPLRRLVNIYVYNTKADPFVPEEYTRHKEFSHAGLLNSFNIVPTFQTISRFTNYLLCKQAIIQNTIDKIHTPEIYLVHIPGNPTDISDENYIIVEKEISHIENAYTSERAQVAFTQETMTQLYTIITQCGIFDFNGENLYIDEHNNLVVIDLEQGIVENPADFFNKDKEMFDFRVYEGITSFAETYLEDDVQAYSFWRSLVVADNALRTSTEWLFYKRFFSIEEKNPKQKKKNRVKTIKQKKKITK